MEARESCRNSQSFSFSAKKLSPGDPEQICLHCGLPLGTVARARAVRTKRQGADRGGQAGGNSWQCGAGDQHRCRGRRVCRRRRSPPGARVRPPPRALCEHCEEPATAAAWRQVPMLRRLGGRFYDDNPLHFYTACQTDCDDTTVFTGALRSPRHSGPLPPPRRVAAPRVHVVADGQYVMVWQEHATIARVAAVLPGLSSSAVGCACGRCVHWTEQHTLRVLARTRAHSATVLPTAHCILYLQFRRVVVTARLLLPNGGPWSFRMLETVAGNSLKAPLLSGAVLVFLLDPGVRASDSRESQSACARSLPPRALRRSCAVSYSSVRQPLCVGG